MLTELDDVKKGAVFNSIGIRYSDFRISLTPRYSLAWLHIFLGYAVLMLIVVCMVIIQAKFPNYFWITIPLSALLIGYWIAYIHLFIHEAAHYNLAKKRESNDILANIFIGMLIGIDVKFYRAIHFDHHRFLGTTKDTEKTYFESLNWHFILASLVGIRVVKVLMAREKRLSRDSKDKLTIGLVKRNKKMFVVSILLNVGFSAIMFAFNYWQVAFAWVAGLFVIFPFMASLRQLLEHRGEDARSSINYNKTNPPKISRMFGEGLVASTMGAAGFNRHLIHHWDPQISYTRLKEVEMFLRDSDVKLMIIKNSSSYFKTFSKLFNK